MLAHHVAAGGISVHFGAKRTFSDQRFQSRIYEYAP